MNDIQIVKEHEGEPIIKKKALATTVSAGAGAQPTVLPKPIIVIKKKELLEPVAPELAPTPALAPTPTPATAELPKPIIVIKKKESDPPVSIVKIVGKRVVSTQQNKPTSFNTDIQINQDTVLSFDVGIKNLAYCILSLNPKYKINKEIGKYQIHGWGIINLITEEDDYICTGILKGGKNKGQRCANKASFFKSGDKKKCFCSIHKPSDDMVPIKMLLKCESKIKSGAKSGAVCGKDATYYKELDSCERVGYCTIHSKNIVDLKRYYTVDNIDDTELKVKLFTALDLKPEFRNVSTVLIEHQPLHAREKIKSIATSLYDYFVIRGIIDEKKAIGVRSIDAKNKLTVYDGPPLSCPLKEQYERNKWYGCKYCEWAIRYDTEYHEFFSTFNKQDDLADSMLQGAWFLSFGIYGKTGDITSNHQKLVYFEQNSAKFKKIRAVKPADKQIKKGRYSLSNIRYLANKHKIADYGKINGLLQSINFYFTSIDQFKEVLEKDK